VGIYKSLTDPVHECRKWDRSFISWNICVCGRITPISAMCEARILHRDIAGSQGTMRYEGA
jgi:hypothetical protein